MKKRQLKEFERLLKNCKFYLEREDIVRFVNEVGALRGFTYALRDDWNSSVSLELYNEFLFYIGKYQDYISHVDTYDDYIDNFFSCENS